DLSFRGMPRIEVVNHQVGNAEQLQPCRAEAFSFRGDRAVKVTKPDVQDELGPALRRIGGERPENGVVKAVRQVRFQLGDVHLTTLAPFLRHRHPPGRLALDALRSWSRAGICRRSPGVMSRSVPRAAATAAP